MIWTSPSFIAGISLPASLIDLVVVRSVILVPAGNFFLLRLLLLLRDLIDSRGRRLSLGLSGNLVVLRHVGVRETYGRE